MAHFFVFLALLDVIYCNAFCYINNKFSNIETEEIKINQYIYISYAEIDRKNLLKNLLFACLNLKINFIDNI